MKLVTSEKVAPFRLKGSLCNPLYLQPFAIVEYRFTDFKCHLHIQVEIFKGNIMPFCLVSFNIYQKNSPSESQLPLKCLYPNISIKINLQNTPSFCFKKRIFVSETELDGDGSIVEARFSELDS